MPLEESSVLFSFGRFTLLRGVFPKKRGGSEASSPSSKKLAKLGISCRLDRKLRDWGPQFSGSFPQLLAM